MVSISPINNITFTGDSSFNGNTDRRKKVEDAASIGGTTMAGAAAAKKGAWSYFNSSSKIGTMSVKTQEAIRATAGTAKKTQSIFAAFGQNVAKFRKIALDFAEGFKSTPVLKKVLGSKLYRRGAGGFGYTMAAFVALSGITKVFSTLVDKAG